MGTIYVATCKKNGKKYVGQTKRKFSQRMINYKHEMSKSNYNRLFVNALKKYGIEGFEWEVLDNNNYTSEWLDFLETSFIHLLNTVAPNGYNLREGGQRGKWTLHTSTKRKLSEYRKGKSLSEETKKKISDSLRGRSFSEETISRMKKARNTREKGIPLSDEHKSKLREALIGNTNSLGFKHSAETKAKMSEIRKGKAQPWERIQVVCVETGVVFESIKAAAEWCGGDDGNIAKVCKHIGNHKIVKGYHWQFWKDYIQEILQPIKEERLTQIEEYYYDKL